MKRVFVLLAALGLAFSPLMVSSAAAAPVRHHAAKSHRQHAKKRAVKHHVRKHKRKTAV